MQENEVSSINGAEKVGYPNARNYKQTPILHHSKKLTWIEDSNVRPETVNPWEEIIGANILDSRFSNDFFIKHYKRKQHKLEQTSGTTSNYRASAQQRKQSINWKYKLDWEKISQTTYL